MTITTVTDVADPALVGHKFARLHRMRAAGFPVPDLVTVPANVFDAAWRDVDPGDGPDRWARAAAALRAAPVPDGILAEVRARFGSDAVFAVRACAVASTVDGKDGEDGADPFAGMSDSFLYVPADRVADRIAACWASAFTARAVAYRELRGLDPARTRIAVGVQLMVPGTRSFVAFTRDPRDGARRTVIAAAHGIGEGVVQEKADVDHFHVTGTTVTADLVRKERMVGPPAPGTDELALLPVPAGLADAPVLDDRTARAVAALAARAETFFGGPQDVEGTITADGTLHLVQARPMVMPAGPPVYWANHNITESYPGISGALTFSQAQEFYRRAFGDLYHRMGVPARTVDANRHHLEQLVAHLDGRIYYRLGAWHALHGQMPVFDLVRDVWQDGMGVTGEARPPVTRPRRRAWLALPGTLLRATRHPRQATNFLRWWDGVMADTGDLSGRTPHQLVAAYRELWAAMSVRWGVTLTNSIYGLLAVKALMRLLDRWADGAKGLLTGLLAGGPANRSLQSVRAAVALAELVAADPGLRAAVESGERPREVWHDISTGQHGTPLAEAAADYLRRYSDRALHDLKLEQSTPRQQPWTLLELLRPYITQGRTVEALLQAEQRAAHQAAEELAARCPGRLRRTVLRTLSRYVRFTARVREDTRFCRTQLYGLSRDILWRLGGDLHATGHLDDPLDIRDLTVAEVLGAYDGTLPCAALRDLAAARRRERLLAETRPGRPGLLRTPATGPLADTLPGAVAVTTVRAADAAGVLTGLGSAPGVVRAPARLVLDPSVPPETCRDAILVARETDPGWLFLMMAAKGLVVERGTLLSHTAITGRLLGVPTVVAVQGATSRIPEGALIELDGTAGTVRILAEVDPS
ncbi:PEP-utilizing enzyme [Dactylosporangium fulvum]|uniref:PEP-utilizing enzyme n=1 Tax=Dactylosporangium fulvum TaxID=53359 RepID=A0ABY5VT27_9ACTN|nr:PEP/pyruvate-binding domain-containing protein [Dactylosporangium fulvum]UWP80430.1 PEP-utilizing enzyme [Dactylosporangium fulvum]